MARYVEARRALAAQVHAQTPMRFLHRLDLLPHLPASPPPLWEWSDPGTYDEPYAPDRDPVEEWTEGQAEPAPRVIDGPIADVRTLEREARPPAPVADRHRPEPPAAGDRVVRRTPVRPPIVITPAATTPVVSGRDRQPPPGAEPEVLGVAPSSVDPRPESVPDALILPESPAAVLEPPGVVRPPAPERTTALDAVVFEPQAAAAPGAPEAAPDLPPEAVRLAEAVAAVQPAPPAPPVAARVAPPAPDRVPPPVRDLVAPPVRDRVAPPVRDPALPPSRDLVPPPARDRVAPPVRDRVAPPVRDRVAPPAPDRVAPPVRDRVVPPLREPKPRPATSERAMPPVPAPAGARTPDLSPPLVVSADPRPGDTARAHVPPVEGRAESASNDLESPAEGRVQIARGDVVPGPQPPAAADAPVAPEAREVEAVRVSAGPAAVEPAREATVPRRARIQEMPAESRTPKVEAAGRIEQERPRSPRAGRDESGPAAAPPVAAGRDSVFTLDDGVDRSPAAWAARLAQGARPPASKSDASGTALPARPRTGDARPPRPRQDAGPPAAQQPRRSERDRPVVPLSISPAARRFLTPLVGIDPAQATIVQGPGADQSAAEHRADAVTAGDTIALSSSFESDSSPEGLGLLAHELTHVARRATPRFVPPVARRGDASEPVADSDEEALALRVEGRVRALAPRGLSSEPQAAHDSESAPGIDAVPHPAATFRAPVRRAAATEWGGLPAPWEPLPDLPHLRPDARAVAAARPIASTPRTAPTAAAAFAAPVAAPVPTVAARPSAPAPAATVRAADIGRTPEAGEAQGGGEPAKAGPPDLDRLARQVYSVLKRRLQADARRERA